jgi:hypothetical protein
MMYYFWQTTAYALMYEELIGTPIDNLVVIIAVKDSSPIIFQEKTSDHLNGLADVIKYYHQNKA